MHFVSTVGRGGGRGRVVRRGEEGEGCSQMGGEGGVFQREVEGFSPEEREEEGHSSSTSFVM